MPILYLNWLVAGFPTAAARVQTRSGHVGFCDGQKWRWRRFSPRTAVSPANLHSICFSTIIFTITRGWHNSLTNQIIIIIKKITPQLGHDRFLPAPFINIIQLSSHYRKPYSPDTEKASLNNPQKIFHFWEQLYSKLKTRILYIILRPRSRAGWLFYD
jgi:hypothetical protein